MNVFINRVGPYSSVGRFQTEEESNQIAVELQNFLTKFGVSCRYYNGSTEGFNVLVQDILKKIGRN